MPQSAAAQRLSCSVTKLWRLERGELPVRWTDVKAMCELYEADEQMTEALLALAPQTKADGWWHDFGTVPAWFELYIRLEEAASRIREYQSELVPGYLQTREYATAVISMRHDETVRRDLAQEQPVQRLGHLR